MSRQVQRGAGVVVSAVCMLAGAGLVMSASAAPPVNTPAGGKAQAGVGQAGGSFAGASDELPTSIVLTGVVRDFRDRQTAGGHPDFNFVPRSGAGVYVGIVADHLNDEGDPVFASGGSKVSMPWTDRAGRAICPPKPYIASRPGDVPGRVNPQQTGAVNSAQSFASWFKDWPGVNQSGLQTIELKRQPGTNVYVFDGRLNAKSADQGGYDVNGKGVSAQGGNPNRSFTFELETTFVHARGSGAVLTFAADDDLWVFIDGRLVVDLGGVHDFTAQSIELDRLEWLENGRTYTMKIFYADRRKPDSRLRIETTAQLRAVQPPAVSTIFD